MNAPVPLPMNRPAVPPRPTVPTSVSQPPAQTAPVQMPTVPATVEVGKATVEQSIPVQSPTVQSPTVDPNAMEMPGTASTNSPVEQPKKRGRQKGQKIEKKTSPWGGIYALNADGSDYLYDKIQVESGEIVDQPRRKKIVGVPSLVVKDANGTPDGGYDPDSHDRLRPKDFQKLGDYYRFEISLKQRQIEELSKRATDADAGKIRQSKTSEKDANEIKRLLSILAAKLSPEELAALNITIPAA